MGHSSLCARKPYLPLNVYFILFRKALESLAGRESGEPQRVRDQAQREMDSLRDAFSKRIADLEQVSLLEILLLYHFLWSAHVYCCWTWSTEERCVHSFLLPDLVMQQSRKVVKGWTLFSISAGDNCFIWCFRLLSVSANSWGWGREDGSHRWARKA